MSQWFSNYSHNENAAIQLFKRNFNEQTSFGSPQKGATCQRCCTTCVSIFFFWPRDCTNIAHLLISYAYYGGTTRIGLVCPISFEVDLKAAH